MELLKEKLAQLRLEAEEARKEADKEILEKEEASHEWKKHRRSESNGS